METLFVIVTLLGFASFAGVMIWAEIYTRDVRAKWAPTAAQAPQPTESMQPQNPAPLSA